MDTETMGRQRLGGGAAGRTRPGLGLLAPLIAIAALAAGCVASPGSQSSSHSSSGQASSSSVGAPSPSTASPSPTPTQSPAPAPSATETTQQSTSASPSPSAGQSNGQAGTGQPAVPPNQEIAVLVTSVTWDAASTSIQVFAQVTAVVTDSGTCTATAQSAADTSTTSVQAVFDGRGTSCGLMAIPMQGKQAGTWLVTVAFVSPDVTSTAKAVSVEIS